MLVRRAIQSVIAERSRRENPRARCRDDPKPSREHPPGQRGMTPASTPNSMPRSPEELERMAAERFAIEREVQRIYRRDFLRTCAECVGWCVAGLLLMGRGFHVTDVQLGWAWLYGGMTLGSAGILWSLFSAWKRGEERGDW